MTIFVIKILDCITMIIDHIKYAIPFLTNEITLYFGRISFPLFAFCAVEGYIHTSNLKNYIKRIFIVGLVSQVPFMLFRNLKTIGDPFYLNIMFTILLGFLVIKIYEIIDNKFLTFLGILGACELRTIFKGRL